MDTNAVARPENIDRSPAKVASPAREARKAKTNRRTTSISSSESETSAKFTDTVILVKRPNYDQSDSTSRSQFEPSDLERRAAIRSEPWKKAFFSRAASIVKKPYDWIKDLAAKLK